MRNIIKKLRPGPQKAARGLWLFLCLIWLITDTLPGWSAVMTAEILTGEASLAVTAAADIVETVPYAQAFGKISDPDTSNAVFASGDTSDNGRIWTDKSVNAVSAVLYDIAGKPSGSVPAKPDEFLVTLSAMAQAFEKREVVEQPSDTVFVLDISSSMFMNKLDNGQSRVAIMIEALNTAIRTLMSANPQNRIAVVAFGGDSGDSRIVPLLKLGYYPADKDCFYMYSPAYIGITDSVNDAQLTTPNGTRRVQVMGGTPTQRGIYAGAKILMDNTDIKYQYTVNNQPQEGIRKPNIVLLTDGGPTLGWTDYKFEYPASDTDAGYDSGNAELVEMGIDTLTVLTAAYFKKQVHDRYYGADDTANAAGFFNIGLGVRGSEDASAVLDPAGYTNGKTNPSAITQSYSGTVYNMQTALDNFIRGTATFPALVRDGGSKRRTVTVANAGVTTYDYADRYYAPETSQELIDMFDDVTQQIVAASNYSTQVDPGNDKPMFSGLVEFVDVLGENMEFKGFEGIWFNNVQYDGRNFAEKITKSDSLTLDSFIGSLLNNSQLAFWSQYLPPGENAAENAGRSPTVTSLIDSSKAAGASGNGGLYYNGPTDFGNQISYYADENKHYIGNYFAGGVPAPAPAGAVSRIDLYGVSGEMVDMVSKTKSDLVYTIFQVITPLDGGQQTVRWLIPASLLPHRIVNAEGGGIRVAENIPIRSIYAVGLKDNLTFPASSPDGKYYFYTNGWQRNQAMAFFAPSIENPYYYQPDGAGFGPGATGAVGKTVNATDTVAYSSQNNWQSMGQQLQQLLGNNGRLAVPLTSVTVNKTWDVMLGNGYIKPEYVQLYGTDKSVGNDIPIGPPVPLNPSNRTPRPGTDPDPTASYTWAALPVYELDADDNGNASFIQYTVKEGTLSGDGVFTPYIGDGSDANFIVSYSQPVWNQTTQTWAPAVIKNVPKTTPLWFLNVFKNFEGLDPSQVFSDPMSIEFVAYGRANENEAYNKVTWKNTKDERLFYPRDFSGGRFPLAIDVRGLTEAQIIFIEKNRAVPDYSRTSSIVDDRGNGLPQITAGTDIDQDGTSDVMEGDFAFELSVGKEFETLNVTLTNRYAVSTPPQLTLQKTLAGGDISPSDNPDITFVVEGWENADAVGDETRRVFYDTTGYALIRFNGGSVTFPIPPSLENSFAAQNPGYIPVTHPAAMPPGYYTVTEMNENGIVKGGYVYDAVLTATVDGAPTDLSQRGITLANGSAPVVNLTNTYYRRPRLTIAKEFKGDVPVPLPGGIVFTVADVSVDGVERIVKIIQYSEFTNGRYILNNLPPGKYMVRELAGDETDGGGLAVNVTVTPGSIMPPGGDALAASALTLAYYGDETVTFTNTYDQRRETLTIQKTLEGAYSDWGVNEETQFQAKIRVVGGGNAGQYLGFNAENGYKDMSASGSIVYFTAQNPAVLHGIPAGTYAVEEIAPGAHFTVDGEAPPADAYQLVSYGGDGVTEAGGRARGVELAIDGTGKTVSIINTYEHGTGKLILQKALGGVPSDWGVNNGTQFQAQIFESAVDSMEKNLLLFAKNDANIYYCIGVEGRISDENFTGKPVDNITVFDTIPFSVNSPAVLDNLWEGVTYTVEEVQAQGAHYTASVEGNGQTLPLDGNAAVSGNITVKVTNTYEPGTNLLIVEKQLAGSYSGWNVDSQTEFRAQVINLYDNTFLTFTQNPDGSYHCYGNSGAAPEGDSNLITFSQSQPAVLRGLWPNHAYRIREIPNDQYAVGYTGNDALLPEGRTNVVTVTNTYVPAATALVIKKALTGSPGAWGISTDTVFQARVKIIDDVNNLTQYLQLSQPAANAYNTYYAENTGAFGAAPILPGGPEAAAPDVPPGIETETSTPAALSATPFTPRRPIAAADISAFLEEMSAGPAPALETPQTLAGAADPSAPSTVNFSVNQPATIINLPNLPAGYRYVVEEVGPNGETVSDNTPNGVSVPLNTVGTAVITNHYTLPEGTLTLYKELTGGYEELGITGGTTFPVRVKDVTDDNPALHRYLILDSHNAVTGVSETGGTVLEISRDVPVTLTGLQTGRRYQAEETVNSGQVNSVRYVGDAGAEYAAIDGGSKIITVYNEYPVTPTPTPRPGIPPNMYPPDPNFPDPNFPPVVFYPTPTPTATPTPTPVITRRPTPTPRPDKPVTDEPDDPNGPGEPDEPTGTDEPNEPDGPNEPTGTDEPNDEPGEPDRPVGPDEPVQPTGPAEPANPEQPSGPTEPSGPIDSDGGVLIGGSSGPNTPDNSTAVDNEHINYENTPGREDGHSGGDPTGVQNPPEMQLINPKTGREERLAWWVLLFVSASLAAAGLGIYRKKKS